MYKLTSQNHLLLLGGAWVASGEGGRPALLENYIFYFEGEN